MQDTFVGSGDEDVDIFVRTMILFTTRSYLGTGFIMHMVS